MRKIGTIIGLLLITCQLISGPDFTKYQDVATEIVILGDDELIEGGY